MTARTRLRTAAAALTGVLLGATAAQAGSVAVKRDVTVTDGMIRLGDVFAGAGERGNAPITRAPAAGETVTLEADWLARVAASYSLGWSPRTDELSVDVTRAAERVGAHRIKAALTRELKRRDVRPPFEVTLNNRDVEMIVPRGAATRLRVTQLRYRPGAERFSATFEARAGDELYERASVDGKVVQRIEVPVAAGTIDRGDRIQKGDLKRVEMRRDRLPSNVVTSIETAVGKEVTRRLSDDRPIRRGSIRRPVVVSENSSVTLKVSSGAMRLTAKGRAMQSGARGDSIRVMNTASKNTVTGKVVSANTVKVMP